MGQFWMGLEDLAFTAVCTATIQPFASHYTNCPVQVTVMMYQITELQEFTAFELNVGIFEGFIRISMRACVFDHNTILVLNVFMFCDWNKVKSEQLKKEK